MASLQVDGATVSGQEDLSDAADTYFAAIYGGGGARGFGLYLDVLHVPTHDLGHLELPITEEEVWEVIKRLPTDKDPGPDGFSGRFYVSCWQVIKVDFMKAIGQFSKEDFRGLHCINTSLMSLLPKIDGAEELRNFRPICLIHGASQIVVKVLANRLATELPKIVGGHQCAFVRGRTLHDNFMLVQAMARRLHAYRGPVALWKLDIMKAFDTLDWAFLLEVQRKMGYGARWIN